MWSVIIAVIIVIIIMSVAQRNPKLKTSDEINNEIDQSMSQIENFTITSKVDSFSGYFVFAIDERNEKIAYVNLCSKKVFSFTDVVGVELIENGRTISKKSTTRIIGGAIVGGVLAGGVGTIVGGLSGSPKQKYRVSSISVKILLRNLNETSFVIECLESSSFIPGKPVDIDTENPIYIACKKVAEDIRDLVSIVIDRVDNKTSVNKQTDSNEIKRVSISDELMKLSDLKDKGILTEEEFLIQKNKILNG